MQELSVAPNLEARPVSDTETTDGLWAGIFARFEASLDGVGKALRRRNRLDALALPVWHSLGSVSVLANAPVIVNLGTPPPGYYWRVRALQVTTPPSPSTGVMTAVASVVADIYASSVIAPPPGYSSTSAAIVPPGADWYTSNSLSSSPGSVPFEMVFGSDELTLNSGDNLIVVLTGAGVTNATQLIVGGYVHQYQGFDSLRDN